MCRKGLSEEGKLVTRTKDNREMKLNNNILIEEIKEREVGCIERVKSRVLGKVEVQITENLNNGENVGVTCQHSQPRRS